MVIPMLDSDKAALEIEIMAAPMNMAVAIAILIGATGIT